MRCSAFQTRGFQDHLLHRLGQPVPEHFHLSDVCGRDWCRVLGCRLLAAVGESSGEKPRLTSKHRKARTRALRRAYRHQFVGQDLQRISPEDSHKVSVARVGDAKHCEALFHRSGDGNKDAAEMVARRSFAVLSIPNLVVALPGDVPETSRDSDYASPGLNPVRIQDSVRRRVRGNPRDHQHCRDQDDCLSNRSTHGTVVAVSRGVRQ